METNSDGHQSKKRKKKKCKRRKKAPINEMDSKLIAEIVDEKNWDIADVSTILYKNKPTVCQNNQVYKVNQIISIESVLGLKCTLLFLQMDVNLLFFLSEQMTQISRRYGKIRLRRLLNDFVPRHAHRRTGFLISHPLSKQQLNSFTAKFLLLLFNEELIDPENLDCLRRNIVAGFADLKIRGQLMTKKELFDGIRYVRLKWLNGMHFQLKEAIVQNLLKFILKLYTEIFSQLFYTTLNSAGKIVHYRRDVWRRITLESFDLLRAERKLQPFTLSSNSTQQKQSHFHGIRFLPKIASARPIVMLYEPKIKQLLTEVRAVLRYVMNKQPKCFGWGILSIRLFQSVYRKFLVHRKHERNQKEVHFCTADLQNCYTSLDHTFLEEILKETIPARSIFKVLRAQIHNPIQNYKTIRTVAGSNYHEALTRLQCKSNEQIVSNPTVSTITGAEILDRVLQYTMKTIVKRPNILGKKRLLFQCNRGIAQGNQLSVNLCNLYLGAMERAIFPECPKNLLCRRYMDDYILMAYQKEGIEQVMDQLLAEAPKYGLHFGKILASFRGSNFLQKQRGNARVLRRNEKMQWCGLGINTHTLSMTLDYKRYKMRCPTLNIPTNLHPSQRFHAICDAMKRALKGRMLALRDTNRVWPAKRRLALRRKFCHFACTTYLMKIRDKEQLLKIIRWIFKSFQKNSIPYIDFKAMKNK